MNTPARSLMISLVAPAVLNATATADQPLRQAAAAAGLTPTLFAVTGVTESQIAAFFQRVRGTPEVSALLAAQAGAIVASANLKRAMETKDPLDPAGFSAIQAAMSASQAAQAELAIATSAFFARAAGSLSVLQRAGIERWRSAHPEFPPEFRLALWTEGQAPRLLAALREERVALANQSAISAATASRLAIARARAEVVEASTRLSNNLAGAIAAFERATE